MSHFTVLVIGDNVEEQLAPYHEFECTGEDNQYVQEIDQTETTRKEYEEHTEPRYMDPEGNLHDPYEDRFYREPTPEESKKIGPIAGTGGGNGLSWTSKDWEDGRGYRTKIHFMPDGWKEVRLKGIEAKSFAEFIEYWHSRQSIVEGTNPDLAGKHKYGYTVVDKDGNVVKTVDRTNPNAKWDWYQIGGRWNGFFKIKTNGLGLLGKPGIQTMDKDYEAPKGDRADQAIKHDIDFDGMRAEARDEAAAKYDLVHGIVKDLPLWLSWEKTREKFSDDIEKARDFYWEQAGPKALRSNEETIWIEADEFLCDREVYLDRAAKRAFRTFAIVHESQWYSKGRMGWWGAVHDEKDEDLWDDEFAKLLDSLPDNTLLSVVDCHI